MPDDQADSYLYALEADGDLSVYEIDRARASDLILIYGAGSREKTNRVITPLRLGGQVRDGDCYLQVEYIEAFCHLREQVRCFRMDRIIEVADAETGEILKTAGLMQRMPLLPIKLDVVAPSFPIRQADDQAKPDQIMARLMIAVFAMICLLAIILYLASIARSH